MAKKDKQRLELVERKFLNLSGVKDVISYDESSVNLETNLGSLLIKGEGLNIKELNLEESKLLLTGKVSQLIYEQSSERGWFKKLFR